MASGDLYVNSRLTIPAMALDITQARSSGPGGQNVNKVNSKVVLRWKPEAFEELDIGWYRRFWTRYGNRFTKEGEFVLQSDQYRDRERNLADVRQRLVGMLLECQNPPKARKATRPSLASKKRRLNDKRQRSEKKGRRQSPRFDD